ncbi:hypothetical protein QVD17_07015 [Tagetes erecta]|uniref:Uncharacterized protein n=1 Tax=Tagetes erecta TaxID=13708 RepID=A0AAD8LPK0_TARER|nr:hypothetical protein QVD17_15674 [Tagetes erecta]KAK1441175.1 hypothetical protein QVD17_07015 [Tagetes erecta]
MKYRAIRMEDLKHVADEFNTSKCMQVKLYYKNDFQKLKDKKIKINNLKHDIDEFKKAKLDLFNKVDADSSVKIIYYGAMLNPYKSDPQREFSEEYSLDGAFEEMNIIKKSLCEDE